MGWDWLEEYCTCGHFAAYHEGGINECEDDIGGVVPCPCESFSFAGEESVDEDIWDDDGGAT